MLFVIFFKKYVSGLLLLLVRRGEVNWQQPAAGSPAGTSLAYKHIQLYGCCELVPAPGLGGGGGGAVLVGITTST